LEMRRFDQALTPAEAVELEELHRQYPKSAERIRSVATSIRRLSAGAQTGRE
jgi:hypothetical protein